MKEEGEDEAEERVGEEAVAEERCRQTGLFSGSWTYVTKSVLLLDLHEL